MKVTTMIAETPSRRRAAPRLLWLDLTRKCQMSCVHCYNSSGPDGTHGTMTRQDWIGVLDQAAAHGIDNVQFIGGEPTLHPDAVELVEHALTVGLGVEIFTNLAHVSSRCWMLFQRKGVSVATSYYSDHAEEHNAITGRPTHRFTRANIAEAVRLGIRLRVGIIACAEDQRVIEARRDLETLGVTHIRVDCARPFGRAAGGATPDMTGLCGACGTGKAAIGPRGDVAPCVFSTWMGVGNVHDTPLAAILDGTAMAEANASIRTVARRDGPCDPDEECRPGFPGSGCNPRT